AGAGELEIGEIGARDEQDEASDTKEHQKRSVVPIPQGADSVPRRDCFQPELLVSLERPRGIAGRNRGFEEAGTDRLKMVGGLSERPAGLEASHYDEPEIIAPR